MVELLHLTDAEYFAIPNRFHASSTANLLQSPARYAAAEYEQTDSKDLGSYIHGLMSGDLARLHAVGFDAVLQKPLRLRDFLDTVQRLLAPPAAPD